MCHVCVVKVGTFHLELPAEAIIMYFWIKGLKVYKFVGIETI